MRGISTGLAIVSLVWLTGVGCNGLPAGAKQEAAVLAADVLPAVSFAVLAENGKFYYSASVDNTAISLQKLMQDLGLKVEVNRSADGTVRIASALPDGTKFAMVVSSNSSSKTARTQVALSWDDPKNSQRGLQVLLDLERQKKS